MGISGTATEVTISPSGGNVTNDADKKITVTPTVTTTYTISAKNGTASASPKTVTVTVTGGGGGTTPTYDLTLNKSGTGEGNVTSEPAGINCGDDCSSDRGTYNANVVVTLTAEEAEGSTFAGWGGACVNSTGACEVTMNQAKTVTATFDTASTPLEAPEIESFGAERSEITAGESVNLVWSLSGGPSDFSLIMNDVTEQNLTVTGRTSVSVSPDSTTTYRLSVTNDAGDDVEYTTVTVN